MKKAEIKEVKEALESMDFEVYFSEEEMTVSKFSPAGQDFSFFIELEEDDDISDIADKVREYYEAYDPSEEAYLWLDDSGHGKNGAPYEMGDVYEDMKACEKYIDDVYNILSNLLQD